MPICLASEPTSVVLAGDHHEMSHKVFSQEDKSQKFHHSLVERLFIHYQTYSNNADIIRMYLLDMTMSFSICSSC